MRPRGAEHPLRWGAADLITASRILFSGAMLPLPPGSPPFGVLYLLCGVSDAADGIVARKTHTESAFGAALDSLADLVFFGVSAAKLLPLLRPEKRFLLWAAGIAAAKGAGAALRVSRRLPPMPPHTALNRLTGVLLYLLPLTVPFAKPRVALSAVCVSASLAAAEELGAVFACGFPDPENELASVSLSKKSF